MIIAVTKSLKRSPTLQADNRVVVQEISGLLLNMTVTYHVHKDSSEDTILRCRN